jgi:hypothetical protein
MHPVAVFAAALVLVAPSLVRSAGGSSATPPGGSAAGGSSSQGGAGAKPGAESKPEPTSPPPPEANDLARALLSQAQWSRILDSYATSLSGQITQVLTSKGQTPPEGLRPRLRAELEKALPYDETVKAQAEALSRQLTPAELKKTANFYGSPLGKKVLDRLPEAQAQVAEKLETRLQTAVPDIVNRVAPQALAARPGTGKPPQSGTGAGGPEPQELPPAQGGKSPPEGPSTQ